VISVIESEDLSLNIQKALDQGIVVINHLGPDIVNGAIEIGIAILQAPIEIEILALDGYPFLALLPGADEPRSHIEYSWLGDEAQPDPVPLLRIN
jgi:hypothetical protein